MAVQLPPLPYATAWAFSARCSNNSTVGSGTHSEQLMPTDAVTGISLSLK